MRAILFLSVFFFSCNINAATLSTALSLNGLQWAQLSDTAYLYVPDVYDACGNSGGTCNGLVDGKDLTGWRWANQSEVNTLINDVFGLNPPGAIDTSIWFDYFTYLGKEGPYIYTIGLAADFITYSEPDGVIISGNPSSTFVEMNTDNGLGMIGNFDQFQLTYDLWGFDPPPYPNGFFMVKGDYTPPSAVPLPASLFLFAPALLGLIGFRQKWFNTSLTR